MEEIILSPKGKIYIKIITGDGICKEIEVNNKILLTGRYAMAKSLANQTNGDFDFYIARVLFGNGGTVDETPRYIDDSRTGLFGTNILTKPVIASINPDLPQQVTFTSTVAFDEVVGQQINEMALEMANGDLFSMATFGDISKTSTIQLIFNWRLSIL